MNAGPDGYVYLLCYAAPICASSAGKRGGAVARHYIGWTRNLDRRLEQHRRGGSSCDSRYTQVAAERGIPFEVGGVWEGGRQLERKLKNRKGAPQLCACCNGKPADWFHMAPASDA